MGEPDLAAVLLVLVHNAAGSSCPVAGNNRPRTSQVTISWVMCRLTQLPGAAAWATVGPVLLVLGGGIAYAMTHTINAEDVEGEIPPELELAKPLTAHPRLDGEDREAA
jgi:hypothetical protein